MASHLRSEAQALSLPLWGDLAQERYAAAAPVRCPDSGKLGRRVPIRWKEALVQILVQPLIGAHLFEAFESAVFQLADAFAADGEARADFFQRLRVVVVETESLA